MLPFTSCAYIRVIFFLMCIHTCYILPCTYMYIRVTFFLLCIHPCYFLPYAHANVLHFTLCTYKHVTFYLVQTYVLPFSLCAYVPCTFYHSDSEQFLLRRVNTVYMISSFLYSHMSLTRDVVKVARYLHNYSTYKHKCNNARP